MAGYFSKNWPLPAESPESKTKKQSPRFSTITIKVFCSLFVPRTFPFDTNSTFFGCCCCCCCCYCCCCCCYCYFWMSSFWFHFLMWTFAYIDFRLRCISSSSSSSIFSSSSSSSFSDLLTCEVSQSIVCQLLSSPCGSIRFPPLLFRSRSGRGHNRV